MIIRWLLSPHVAWPSTEGWCSNQSRFIVQSDSYRKSHETPSITIPKHCSFPSVCTPALQPMIEAAARLSYCFALQAQRSAGSSQCLLLLICQSALPNPKVVVTRTRAPSIDHVVLKVTHTLLETSRTGERISLRHSQPVTLTTPLPAQNHYHHSPLPDNTPTVSYESSRRGSWSHVETCKVGPYAMLLGLCSSRSGEKDRRGRGCGGGRRPSLRDCR
jgi:hypothetical protein